MAGPLTWREVSAPNFSGSTAALNTFGTLLNNAAEAGSRALGGFQAAQTDRAGTSALLNEMGYTDPTAAEAIFKNVNREALSMAAMKQIMDQRVAGQQRASAAQTQAKNAYDLKRTQGNDAALAAAAPWAQQLQQAAATGDANLYASVQAAAQRAGAFNGLDSTQLQTLVSGAQSNLAGMQGSLGRTETRNDAGAVARSGVAGLEGDFDAAATVQRIMGDAMLTPQQKIASLRSFGLDNYGQPIGGISSSGSGTGGGGGAGSSGKAAPAIAGTAERLDKVMNSLFMQESGGKQFNKDGSVVTSPKGAIGAAQVMPGTAPEAARMAGLPWDENRYRTDENYNKALGQAYYTNLLNKYGGDEEKALAAYNAGPGAVDRAVLSTAGSKDTGAWLKALPQETQKYVPAVMSRIDRDSSQVPASVQQAQADARTPAQLNMAGKWAGDAINARDAQLASVGIPNLSELEKDQTSTMANAQRMIGKEGSFSGANSADMARLIAEVETKFGVQPSVAAAIIERAGVGDDRNALRRWASDPNVRNMVNMDRLESIGRLVGTGNQRVVDAQRDQLRDASTTVATARQTLTDAQADLAAARRRVAGRPGAAGGLQTLVDRVSTAEAALASAVNAQNTSTSMRPTTINPNTATQRMGVPRGADVLPQNQQRSPSGSAFVTSVNNDLAQAEARLQAASPGTKEYADAERAVQKARRVSNMVGR